MLKLCAKDFVVSRWLWLLVLAANILYFRFPSQQLLLSMVSGIGLVPFCVFVTLFLEDRYKTEVIYASLPLKRSTIVLARYVLVGFLAVASAAWTFVYGYFLNSVVKLRFIRIDLQSLFSIEGIAGYLIFMALLAALFFPFYFRHGLARGSFIFAIVFLTLAIFIVGFERLAANVLHLTGPLFTAEFLKDPGLGIVRAIGGIKDSLGLVSFVGTVFVFMGGILLFSIRLSIRFYNCREF
jgi:ABC-2 type transport system permease protein